MPSAEQIASQITSQIKDVVASSAAVFADQAAAQTAARIMVWSFAEAPAELRALHRGRNRAQWLIMVPHSLCGPDIDGEILRRAGNTDVSRNITLNGDMVYTGRFA